MSHYRYLESIGEMMMVDLVFTLLCVSFDEAPNGGIITFDKLLKFMCPSSSLFSSFSFRDSLNMYFIFSSLDALKCEALYDAGNICCFTSIFRSTILRKASKARRMNTLCAMLYYGLEFLKETEEMEENKKLDI